MSEQDDDFINADDYSEQLEMTVMKSSTPTGV